VTLVLIAAVCVMIVTAMVGLIAVAIVFALVRWILGR
jgi:hypothetical protein